MATKAWYQKNRVKCLAQHKKWRLKNSEKVKTYNRIWREKHSGYFKAWRLKNSEKVKAYDREQYRKNPERLKVLVKALREKKYGVSYPTWWLCDVCNIPISGFELCLDHNHKAGRFRGWVCRRHNTGLGSFHDSIVELQKAIEYLEIDNHNVATIESPTAQLANVVSL